MLIALFTAALLLSACGAEQPTGPDMAALQRDMQERTEDLLLIHLKLDTALTEIAKAEAAAGDVPDPNEPGIAAEIFAEVGKHHIVVDDIIQNFYDDRKLANVGFSTNQDQALEGVEVCRRMAEARGFGPVELDENVSKVSVVGVGSAAAGCRTAMLPGSAGRGPCRRR